MLQSTRISVADALRSLSSQVNFVVMAADAFVAPMPFRLGNATLVVAYGVTYISFSIAYWLLGAKNEWGALSERCEGGVAHACECFC